jgi:hypothetical protein
MDAAYISDIILPANSHKHIYYNVDRESYYCAALAPTYSAEFL